MPKILFVFFSYTVLGLKLRTSLAPGDTFDIRFEPTFNLSPSGQYILAQGPPLNDFPIDPWCFSMPMEKAEYAQRCYFEYGAAQMLGDVLDAKPLQKYHTLRMNGGYIHEYGPKNCDAIGYTTFFVNEAVYNYSVTLYFRETPIQDLPWHTVNQDMEGGNPQTRAINYWLLHERAQNYARVVRGFFWFTLWHYFMRGNMCMPICDILCFVNELTNDLKLMFMIEKKLQCPFMKSWPQYYGCTAFTQFGLVTAAGLFAKQTAMSGGYNWWENQPTALKGSAVPMDYVNAIPVGPASEEPLTRAYFVDGYAAGDVMDQAPPVTGGPPALLEVHSEKEKTAKVGTVAELIERKTDQRKYWRKSEDIQLKVKEVVKAARESKAAIAGIQLGPVLVEMLRQSPAFAPFVE